MGGAENKRGEGGQRGRGLGLGVIGFGFKPGRVKRGYIRAVTQFFLIFPFSFSLFSSLESKTLSSLS